MPRDSGLDELVVGIPSQLGVRMVAARLIAPNSSRDVAMLVVFKCQVLINAQAVVEDHAIAHASCAGAGTRACVGAGLLRQQITRGIKRKQLGVVGADAALA